MLLKTYLKDMISMHKTVLLYEGVESLKIKEDGIYVDATLGFGGHSGLILESLKRGFLFAFDQDEMAISYSTDYLRTKGKQFEIIKSNFANMKEELAKRGVTEVDGIIFDLGVSSPQLDVAERGFSYQHDSKLDMRMDTSKAFSAYNVVNEYSYEELVRILRNYGEEKYASSIAKNIIKTREVKPVETTFELVDIIKKSMPYKAMKDSHPARKTFQAIRIEVNDELGVLRVALKSALELIKVGGRVSVITFHSLEDRIVKETFKKYSDIDSNLAKLPFIPDEYQPKYKVVENITPTKEEIEENNRCRSARLRVIEKIKE